MKVLKIRKTGAWGDKGIPESKLRIRSSRDPSCILTVAIAGCHIGCDCGRHRGKAAVPPLKGLFTQEPDQFIVPGTPGHLKGTEELGHRRHFFEAYVFLSRDAWSVPDP